MRVLQAESIGTYIPTRILRFSLFQFVYVVLKLILHLFEHHDDRPPLRSES